MPIYAYRCSECGHAKDVLQKLSDPVLTQCPACGQATFVKQLTSAGFQLKGSGWYVTDFRDGDKKPAAAPAEGAPAEKGDGAKTEAPAGKGDAAAVSPAPGKGEGSASKSDAPAPAASPAPAPPSAAPAADK
jgi:putative FmdB family regulatory protein